MKGQPTFPKHAGKHGLDSVVLPELVVGHHRESVGKPSEKAIIVFSPRLARVIRARLGLVTHPALNKALFDSKNFADRKGRLILSLTGIGAPVTAVTVEELRSLGVRKFLILGIAGGLSPSLSLGDIVICEKALRDDGTSHHYLPDSLYVSPDESLTRGLQGIADNLRIPYHKGPTWTIDAPYRETREVKRYRDAGVLTVEMEASALFAAAQRRRAKAAAVFAVSDVFTDKGWSGFAMDPATVYSRLAQMAQGFASLGSLGRRV